MSDLILRHLAIDRRTLAAYLSGERPEVESIKSNLFLAEREVDYRLPDHYYQNISTSHLNNCQTLHSLLITAFSKLLSDKTVWRDHNLYIELERFGGWQDLITRFPPLPLIAYAIFCEHGSPDEITERYDHFINAVVMPNLGNTALIGPYHPVLDELSRTPGLYDLHQHLNGTTEADLVWLYALERPYELYQHIKSSYEAKALVREQFSTLGHGLTPESIYERLCIAAALRNALVDEVFNNVPITRNY